MKNKKSRCRCIEYIATSLRSFFIKYESHEAAALRWIPGITYIWGGTGIRVIHVKEVLRAACMCVMRNRLGRLTESDRYRVLLSTNT